MRRGAYIKVAERYSQATPGWVVPDSAPNEWIERVIKPLLADVTTPPPRFEPHYDQQRHQFLQSAGPGGRRARLIGWIHLAVAAKPDAYSSRSYHREQRSLMTPLCWVSAPGVGQQVAIVPQRIGAYSYYYVLSDLNELRYLASPEALRALLEALLEQLRQQDFKDQKVNKVRNLQTQAVQAQLRQIANEERFAFQVTTTARLIRIAVRLDGNNQLTISVPFSEFENVLPQLRETVIHLWALHQRRIHFRTHQCPYGSSPWIEPDPVSSTPPEAT